MRLQRGFTLVELLITVAIVGVLASIAIPSFGAMVSKSRQTEAKAGLAAIHSLQVAYHGEKNTYGSLAEIGFVSEGQGRYGFLIGPDSFVKPAIDVGVGGSDTGLWTDGSPDIYLQAPNGFSDDDDDDDGAAYGRGNPHYSGSSFEVVAIGVISAAPSPNDLDIWSIDNFHSLENLNPGF